MRNIRFAGWPARHWLCELILTRLLADISELFRSLDKPPLAQLPFFIGC